MTRETIALSFDGGFLKFLLDKVPQDVPRSRFIERLLKEKLAYKE